MKSKKAPKNNLENKRVIFFQIGLIVAMLASLYAFEIKSFETTPECKYPMETVLQEGQSMVLPTYRKNIEIPDPLEKPKAPINIDKIIITPDYTPVKQTIHNKTNLDTVEITRIVEPDENDEPISMSLVAEKPIFPGCEGLTGDESFTCFKRKLNAFVKKNIDIPEVVDDYDLYQKAFVQFVVSKEGYVVSVNVVNEVHPDLEYESKRVIELLPDMIPAKKNGIPVSVKFTVPLNYRTKY